VVTSDEYSSELEMVGINVRAKNFLVFKGAVENLSLKTKKEFTSVFEEVSGSIAYKAPYEKCKAELAATEPDLTLSSQKKKNVAAGMAEARMEKVELATYQQQCQQWLKLKTRLNLFKLYQCENQINLSRGEAETLRYKIYQNDLDKAQLENFKLPEYEQRRENVKTSLARYCLLFLSVFIIDTMSFH
jgi:structural maintenance of chromosome 1